MRISRFLALMVLFRAAAGVPAGAGEDELLTLIAEGRGQAALVLPDAPHSDEELAAAELQTHLEKMSGARLPIVRGSGPAGLSPVKIGLALAPAAAAAIRTESADPAAFLIEVNGAGIHLAGLSPEGTLFAAYELLEQLGCRWYLPGDLGTVIPDRATVSVPAGRSVHAPAFVHRHLQAIPQSLPWYRRQKLGGMYFPTAHGIRLEPAADFERTPELFALVNGERSKGQLCVSHPEVVKRATAHALAAFRRYPALEYLGLGPNDGSGFCECPNCRALDAGDWDPYAAQFSVTDRYVWLFNRILAAVHKELAGRKIGFYAYHAYKLPPRQQTPDPHIVPAFAPITLCRIHGLANPICPDRAFYGKLMTEWGRLVPEIFERGYYFNLACPGFPWSKVHALREETPAAFASGIKGWRVECINSWAPYGLTHYVAARLMWNVHTDVDALLADFYKHFFGPAAKPMGAYLDSLDRRLRDTDCHTGSSYGMPAFFPPKWMRSAKRLLNEAARRAGTEPYRLRLRIFRLNYDMLEAFLNMLDARNRLDFTTAQAELTRLDTIIETMIHFRLYPNPPLEQDPNADPAPALARNDARLLYYRPARSYLTRFWRAPVESGYERTCVKGEFAAGARDTWDFLIDPVEVGEDCSWYRDGVAGGNWQRLRTATASWSDQGLHYYKGTAWYRNAVSIPPRFAGRPLFLWFGGVDERADVWLNGSYLGSSREPGHGLPGVGGSFQPFEFDVSAAVRYEEPNVIAVKITNRRLDEIGTGGITAPVMFWSPRENNE